MSPRAALVCCCVVALAACAAEDRGTAARRNLDHLAAREGFVQAELAGGFTTLGVWTRGVTPSDRSITIFLEGDGQPWVTRWQPARDPSPSDPIAFHLAAATPGPVAYLPRPCQFASAAAAANCRVEHWTSHRYGEEVVAAVDRAIGRLAEGKTDVTLVGYSGGGTIAALVAARRGDVRRLVTLAAPLDLAAWSRSHGQAPLNGSLSPLDALDRLSRLPQLHLVARHDQAVPPGVNDRFFAALPSTAVRQVDGDHECCWVERWREGLGR